MTTAAKTKLDNLIKREKELKKQIQLEKQKIRKKEQLKNQRLNAAEKKKDTRRKILLGAYYLDKFKNNPEELTKIMDNYLSRADDRKLFGLSTTFISAENKIEDSINEETN